MSGFLCAFWTIGIVHLVIVDLFARFDEFVVHLFDEFWEFFIVDLEYLTHECTGQGSVLGIGNYIGDRQIEFCSKRIRVCEQQWNFLLVRM